MQFYQVSKLELTNENEQLCTNGTLIGQSEGGGTAPHGIHTSLGALGWGAGCVEDFVVVVSVSVVSVVPGGWVARGLAESPRMLKKSGRPSPYA